jgi:hypothetical protein
LSESEIVTTIRPFIEVLDKLEIPYQIGGSVASSVFGIARSTMDVDMVAAFRMENVAALVKNLETVYYISEAGIKEAIARESSFNLVHLETMMKIDVFILKARSFDQTAFQRRRKDNLDSENPHAMYYVSSPEDIIINKLEWYQKGEMKSERQWRDIIGIMKVQGDSLDLHYCKKWAKQLGLGTLLESALLEAR